MNGDIPAGGRLLDKPTLQINQWRVVPAAVVGVGSGSIAHIDCTHYLQFIDVSAGLGLLVPYDRQALTALRDNLTQLLEGSNHNG